RRSIQLQNALNDPAPTRSSALPYTTLFRSLDALDWTILRPGMLTDDAGTGLVRLEAHTGRGPIPRDDVAAVLAELVDTPATAGLDRKSTRLNSSHVKISYAVFCLKKKHSDP